MSCTNTSVPADYGYGDRLVTNVLASIPSQSSSVQNVVFRMTPTLTSKCLEDPRPLRSRTVILLPTCGLNLAFHKAVGKPRTRSLGFLG